MYRKFYLVNVNGTTQPLTDPSVKVFADNPSGLGFNTSTSFLRLGNDNLLTYEQYSMVTKSFDIRFYEKTIDGMYKQYNDFIKFLTAKPIYLLYEIIGKTYRMKVNVDSVSKSQIDYSNSMLTSSISMTPLSFWEDNVSNVVETSKSTTDGKHYVLTRPYYYGNVTTDNIEITSIGTLPASLQITIDGTVTNPQYNLYDENGTLYGSGRFIGTFDYVFVNADEADETIILKKDGTTLENPYNYQDLTVGKADEILVTFLQMKTGVNKLSFSLDAGFAGTVKLEWRNRYLSV